MYSGLGDKKGYRGSNGREGEGGREGRKELLLVEVAGEGGARREGKKRGEPEKVLEEQDSKVG